MFVSLTAIKDIAKTLPIGYYIRRNVDVTISDEVSASFYSVVDDKIVVSYVQISKALESIDESEIKDHSEVEEIVRSLVYHEVSHAMITPVSLVNCIKSAFVFIPGIRQEDIKNAMNIFEDERIETVLKSFYMKVNFKKLVKLINGKDKISDCGDYESPIQMFYDIVRFRNGPEKFVRRVNDIIYKYRLLHKYSPEYDCSSTSSDVRVDTRMYTKEVLELFKDVVSDFRYNLNKKMDEQENRQNDSQNGQSSSSNYQPKTSDDSEDSDSEETEVESTTPSDEDGEEDSDEGTKVVEEDDQGTDGSEVINEEFPGINEAVREIFDKINNKYNNERLFQDLERIFISSSKIRKMSGSATNSYSGVFDPRSAAREDYRYFVRSSTNGSNKGFSNVHFNLFLDRSGSFDSSVQKANEILHALGRIERKYKNFSFTLITCGHGETIESKDYREHYANDGTEISKNIKKIFNQVQVKNATNFNILLYDGIAYNQCRLAEKDVNGSGENFSAFNTSNTLIIVDQSNEIPVRLYCKKARVVIVGWRESYVDTLEDNLIKSLELLVR